MIKRKPLLWLGFSLGLLGSAVCAEEWTDPGAIIQSFRQRQTLERQEAEQDQARIQSHIQKIQSLRATLSLPKDQESYATLQAALGRDQAALAKAEERIRLSEQAMRIPFVAVPAEIHGRVDVCSGSGEWKTLDANHPLQEGDTIQTGPDGGVDIVFEDGSRLVIRDRSSFILRKQGAAEFIGELLSGRIHFQEWAKAAIEARSRKIIRSVTAICAIRGTDFEMALDEARLTHFVPASGRVDLEALPEGLDRKRLEAWWFGEASPAASNPLEQDRWMKISRLEGEAQVRAAGGALRPARIGDTLRWDEELVIQRGAIAGGVLRGGYQLSMKSSGSVHASREKESVVYEIGPGLYHIRAEAPVPAGVARPRFRTPTAICGVRGTEFALSVDPKGESDFMPLEGKIEVSAGAER